MTLQKQIKKDLTDAIKAQDAAKKDTIRVIMGEFGRIDKKELSDDDVIKIIKKLIKSERELLENKGETSDSEFIKISESYLPALASEEDVLTWIKENIEFSQFKNKMQAMGPIMKHFGAAADGNIVKKILQKL